MKKDEFFMFCVCDMQYVGVAQFYFITCITF